MIACFLSNISAKYYKNPSMLSRVIAKNVGDVFFETQCRIHTRAHTQNTPKERENENTLVQLTNTVTVEVQATAYHTNILCAPTLRSIVTLN